MGGTPKPSKHLAKQLSSRGRKQSQSKATVQYCVILYGQSSGHILQTHKKQRLVNLLSQSDPCWRKEKRNNRSVRNCWWSVPVYSQKGKAQPCLHLRALAASANSLHCDIWSKSKLLRCLRETFIAFKSISKNVPYSDFKYTQENFPVFLFQFIFLSQLTKPHNIFTMGSASPHLALKHTLKNEAGDSQTLVQHSEENWSKLFYYRLFSSVGFRPEHAPGYRCRKHNSTHL